MVSIVPERSANRRAEGLTLQAFFAVAIHLPQAPTLYGFLMPTARELATKAWDDALGILAMQRGKLIAFSPASQIPGDL